MRKMFEKSKKMFVLLLAIVAVALSGGSVSAQGLSGEEFAFRLANDLDGTIGCQPYESVVEELGYTCFSLMAFYTVELTQMWIEIAVEGYRDMWWVIPWYRDGDFTGRVITNDYGRAYSVIVFDGNIVLVSENED